MRIVPPVVLILLLAARAVAQPAPARPLTAATGFVVPAWAYPTQLPPAPDPFPTADSVRLHRIPGGARAFTQKQAFNRFAPADWLPASHPPAPPSVASGRRPTGYACSFCHLYDGAGRPENATMAGLPAEYIVRQVRAFRDSTRRSANPVAATNSMHAIALAVTEADVAEAAAYYTRLALVRRNRVVETAQVPRHRIAGIRYVRDGEGTEPLAGRLIEMPEDAERVRPAWQRRAPPVMGRRCLVSARFRRLPGVRRSICCGSCSTSAPGPAPTRAAPRCRRWSSRCRCPRWWWWGVRRLASTRTIEATTRQNACQDWRSRRAGLARRRRRPPAVLTILEHSRFPTKAMLGYGRTGEDKGLGWSTRGLRRWGAECAKATSPTPA